MQEVVLSMRISLHASPWPPKDCYIFHPGIEYICRSDASGIIHGIPVSPNDYPKRPRHDARTSPPTLACWTLLPPITPVSERYSHTHQHSIRCR